MKRKEVIIPMIVGVGLCCAVLIADICVMLLQKPILSDNIGHESDRFIIPTAFFWHILTLGVFAAFLGVMMLYKGSARRTVSRVMLGIHFVFGASSVYVSLLVTNILYRFNNASYIGEISVLNATANMFTSPLMCGAVICVLVAIGRYGIIPLENEQQ